MENNYIYFKKEISRAGKRIPVLIGINEQAFIKAVDSKWDSFIFATNDEEIAYLKIGKYIFSLYTIGDILVKDLCNNKEYTNKDYEKIQEIAISEEIYDEKLFEIIENNWFAVSVSEENHTFDDIVFTDTPKTENDLIDSLINITKYFLV